VSSPRGDSHDSVLTAIGDKICGTTLTLGSSLLSDCTGDFAFFTGFSSVRIGGDGDLNLDLVVGHFAGV